MQFIRDKDKDQKNSILIADHLRTVVFLLAEGVNFGPKEREYILRKLFKKACLHAFFKGINTTGMLMITEKIIEVNSLFYPHLLKNKTEIIEKIKNESCRQFRFLNAAENKIIEVIEKEKCLSSEKAFFFYDTLGIPLELIELHLSLQNNLNLDEFNKLLEKQQKKSQEERKRKKINVF